MGTYGTSILGNDTAADVAAEFKDSIAYGKTIEEAEDQLIADFCIDDEDDPYEFCPFWLGLAAKQVQMGRLSERTKANALRIIDEGIDIAIWQEENPKLVSKRQAALDKLRKQIVVRQKKPTKVRKPFIDTIEWEEGDGLAYQLPSGKWTAFRVRKVVREPRRQSAFYEVLNLHQQTTPSATDLINASMRYSRSTQQVLNDLESARQETVTYYLRHGKQPPMKYCSDAAVKSSQRYKTAIDGDGFWLSRNSSRENPMGKLVKVATNLETKPKDPVMGNYFGGWKELDRYLSNEYGLS